jgi:hypothetical protein
LAVVVGEILAGRGEEIAEDYPLTIGVVQDGLDRRAREIVFELRAAEERAYLPTREPEPIAPALATGIEIENKDVRAEIDDHAGPWALLSDHWRTD